MRGIRLPWYWMILFHQNLNKAHSTPDIYIQNIGFDSSIVDRGELQYVAKICQHICKVYRMLNSIK